MSERLQYLDDNQALRLHLAAVPPIFVWWAADAGHFRAKSTPPTHQMDGVRIPLEGE